MRFFTGGILWALCSPLVIVTISCLVGVTACINNDQPHSKEISETCTCSSTPIDPLVQKRAPYNFSFASATSHCQIETAPFEGRQGFSPSRKQDVRIQPNMEMCQLYEGLRKITSVLWCLRSVLAHLCRSNISQQCEVTAGTTNQEGTMDICQRLGFREQLDRPMGTDTVSMVQLSKTKTDAKETTQSKEAKQFRSKAGANP